MSNIHTNRKSGFIRRDGGMRRETVWFQFPFASTPLAASATATLVYLLNAAALDLRPFTIVRTRFVWMVASDQSAATETYIGNFGFAIVSDQAAAVGVTAVPTPATDMGSDLWFVLQQWIGEFALIGTDVTTELRSQVIDSKAMRKVDLGQDVAGVAEAGIGGSGARVRTVGRMLVKLH